MMLPVVEAIQQMDAAARISWICGSQVAPLLRHFDCSIHDLLLVDEPKFFGVRGKLLLLLELAKLCTRLIGRGYDLVIIGHRDSRFRLLSRIVRAGERRSFTWNWPVPGRYYPNEYIRLVTGMDGPDTKAARMPILRLGLSASLAAELRFLPRPIIALAPGGAKNTLRDQPLKRWPLEKYAELAMRAIEFGCGVIITGAPSDGWVSAAFRQMPLANLVGKTTITDLVAVYNYCDAVVTHDSGPMHLASLANAPLVSLFGPTDPAWFAPRRDNVKVIWGGSELACRPCYDGKGYAQCFDNRCMQSITVEMVIKALTELGLAQIKTVKTLAGDTSMQKFLEQM